MPHAAEVPKHTRLAWRVYNKVGTVPKSEQQLELSFPEPPAQFNDGCGRPEPMQLKRRPMTGRLVSVRRLGLRNGEVHGRFLQLAVCTGGVYIELMCAAGERDGDRDAGHTAVPASVLAIDVDVDAVGGAVITTGGGDGDR